MSDTTGVQLKDFIYLDIDRVRSFVAQLYSGVPDSVSETKGREQAVKGETSLNIPWLTKVGLEGNVLFRKDTTETRSVHHYLYSMLEQELLRREQVCIIGPDFEQSKWVPDAFVDGSFVLARGTVAITDYRSLVAAIQVIPSLMAAATSFQRQASAQQIPNRKITGPKEQQIDMKQIQQIAGMVDMLYSGISRVKICPYANRQDFRLVGSLVSEYFSKAAGTPLTGSGLASGADWYVMGLVNKPAASPGKVSSVPGVSTLQNLENVLEQVVFAMQGINKFTFTDDFPAISVLPIAVYRNCATAEKS